MPKKLQFEQGKKQLEAIEQTIRYEKDGRVVKRATGLRLLHLGHKPEEVAHMLNVSVATVYNWHERWRSDGQKGLSDKPKSGRPRKADEAYCQELERALDSAPEEYGYRFVLWTVDRLREHLARRTGTQLSNERLRILMQELGYVYRRPTQTLKQAQDQEAHDQTEALIEELKKGQNVEILSYSLWTKQA